jgi:hypothetical protein
MAEFMFDEPMAPMMKQGNFDAPEDHASFLDAQHEPSATKLFKF